MTHHRDVPPEVTTGVVVVVVGCEVVEVFVPLSPRPDEPELVVVVVVSGAELEADEREADEPEPLAAVFWDASEAALTPGCSLDTITPINAVAAAAATMAVRVNSRRSEWARRRASGVWSG